MKTVKHLLALFLSITLLLSCSQKNSNKEFTEHFPDGISRVWIGPQFWANPLQDWEINDGRLECVTSQSNRNVNLLTWRLKDAPGTFVFTVKTGLLTEDLAGNEKYWMGMRIGARGQFNDYRDDAIYGKGLNAGITTKGVLFIGSIPVKENGNAVELIPYVKKGIELKYELTRKDNEYILKLSALDPKTNKVLASIEEKDVPGQQLYGSVALVSDFDKKPRHNELPSCWFDDWTMKGDKLEHHPEREFGPILFSQYTLSRNILKLNVQMSPIGDTDGREVDLQVKENGKWKSIQKAPIDRDSRTALFRMENWDDTKDVPYRLVYMLNTGNGKMKEYHRTGTFRKNPVGKEDFVLAAFTGNNDLGFPNQDVSEAIAKLDPDMLFFSGDQIYEGVGGYGIQVKPLDKAMLDYLRKWYLYGWEYGDLFRDRPVIDLVDDHDVYHGNIWGCDGKHAPVETMGWGAGSQDQGGFKMPARWVNMVQRTQTANLPDPYDPTPVLQGITVYYTQMNYGGISFAIVEDRKWKSAPKPLLPVAKIVNGWSQNLKWNAVTQSDVPGAFLLGKRQLEFLDHWVQDWSHGAKMKVLLTATIFENVATLPKSAHSDAIVPRLRILKEGEYAPDDKPVADFDSNGWPQTERDKAVEIIRKGYTFHVAGDQHLGSYTKYGIDEWRTGSYAFCVPAISNIWPRRWYPSTEGKNHKPGTPKYTGDFLDGFGNKMTVYAIANPVYTGKKPSNLYDRSTGYGIVDFNKNTRDIESKCYLRFEDPTAPDAEQYPGWPITVNQMDNYTKKAYGWLPKVVTKNNDPVIRVYNGTNNELVYAVRIKGNTFDPPVYAAGSYTIEVGNGKEGGYKSFKGQKPNKTKGASTLKVDI